MNKTQHLPNFLIVSGNGRNSGKTGFITRIITNISESFPVTAIKISPHLHKAYVSSGVIKRTTDFILAREKNIKSDKDSSRMLSAGATEVYYIEARDENLKLAFKTLCSTIELKGPVICESGGLRDIIIPSLFVMINRNDGRADKQSYLQRRNMANYAVFFNGQDYDLPPESIYFDGKAWKVMK
jgi:hypothetical protein